MTETPLKPCPFCGERKELATLFHMKKHAFYVLCERCEIKGPIWLLPPEEEGNEQDLRSLTSCFESATERWNTRVGEDE